jgi:uncharacterized protein YjeT (DUF2065 family)
MDYIVLSLGLAAMTQGVPYLLSPKRARAHLKRWMGSDDLTFRTFGAIAFGFGLGILYLGLH